MSIDRLWLLGAGSVTALAYLAVRLVHHRSKYRDLVWRLLASMYIVLAAKSLKKESFKWLIHLAMPATFDDLGPFETHWRVR